MSSQLTRHLTNSTTKADLLKEINGDRIISKFLDEVAKKSDKVDREEITNDTAALIATRMDFVWKSSMSEEEAAMEGISDVTEELVEKVTNDLQEKYSITDKHVAEIHNHLLSYINKGSLSRCASNKMRYLSIGVTVFLLILKIVLFFVIGPGVFLIPV